MIMPAIKLAAEYIRSATNPPHPPHRRATPGMSVNTEMTMKLARDGIQLSFDVTGTGSPQFLFVHGLGGDRTHFAPQMEYFARQGRALNAELRGHGESDKPQQEYSIEGSAEALVWLCAQQQITKAVIVGQSMVRHSPRPSNHSRLSGDQSL